MEEHKHLAAYHMIPEQVYVEVRISLCEIQTRGKHTTLSS